jgi:alpha-galactosidase
MLLSRRGSGFRISNHSLMHSQLCLIILSIMLFGTGFSQAGENKAPRLLFVGNSITLHGPAGKIGWTGNWGMAASSAEKDYVHLVVDAVAKLRGSRPEFQVVNVAEFERAYDTFDVSTKLTDALAFQPDTVILAIGENVPALKSDEAGVNFRESVVRLLTLLKRDGRAALYVRSCFWADAAKDAALKEACATAGGVFVDISALGKDEGNYARSERTIAHEGVARHPGDRGMRAIADAITAALAPPAK